MKTRHTFGTGLACGAHYERQEVELGAQGVLVWGWTEVFCAVHMWAEQQKTATSSLSGESHNI